MKIKFILIFLLIVGMNNVSYSNETNCEDFNKLSLQYAKCKANIAKNKTISAGKKFIEETKDYQKKEWDDE